VISVSLIVLLVILFKGLEKLEAFESEWLPLLSDLRMISLNTAAASESLCNGMQKFGRMTDALGNIGDDLEEGRQAVKGSLQSVSQLVSPWMSLLKLFSRK
jgi:hypothetical protein